MLRSSRTDPRFALLSNATLAGCPSCLADTDTAAVMVDRTAATASVEVVKCMVYRL